MASVVAQSEDWQLRKSVLETNRYMFENQFCCDVKFTFGSRNQIEDTISAHKYVLISRSPVFCAMFTGPAKDDSPEVNIEDSDIDTFKELLRYIYFQDVTLSGENVLSILYLAKKYMIPDLEDLCKTFLEDKLDESNVCVILEQATIFGEDELVTRCFDILDDSSTEALQSDGFAEVNKDTVMKIVERDSLRIDEIDVFKASMRWAEAECKRQEKKVNDENKRLVLGDILPKVRFPLMDVDDFVNIVLVSKVLLPEESVDIMLAMKGKTPHQQSKTFSTSARAPRIPTEEIYRTLPCAYSNKAAQKAAMHIKVKKNSCRNVLISSIKFAVSNDKCVKRVYFNSCHLKNIKPITEWRMQGKHLVYEAALETPVAVKAGETAILEFVLHTDYLFLHVDGSSVTNEYLEFEAPPGEWCKNGLWNHLIGLTYKAFK